MYRVDLYRRVRLAYHHEGLSRREEARRFEMDPNRNNLVRRTSLERVYPKASRANCSANLTPVSSLGVRMGWG